MCILKEHFNYDDSTNTNSLGSSCSGMVEGCKDKEDISHYDHFGNSTCLFAIPPSLHTDQLVQT